MLRTYIDWLLDVPWATTTEDRLDPVEARKVLDEDHYDLDKVKERIVEYLAVRKLKGDMKGPILCFVGPPGVGKTSLGQSIARAMARKFVRISLGGVRDEAEIRGHRRTYIGSIPGASSRRSNRRCDEPGVHARRDRQGGRRFQGDPAAPARGTRSGAEPLVPRSLPGSTGRSVEGALHRHGRISSARSPGAPRPDGDHPARGYSEEEKLHIARKYLLPRQMGEHGLPPGSMEITDAALRLVISEYTREAGVRNLERQLGAIARKVAARLAIGSPVDAASHRRRSRPGRRLSRACRFKKRDGVPDVRPGVATGWRGRKPVETYFSSKRPCFQAETRTLF
jgi:hypothetical protein